MSEPPPLPDFEPYAELGVSFGASTVAIQDAWLPGSPQSTRPIARQRRTEPRAWTPRARVWLMDPVLRARCDRLRFGRGPATPVPDPVALLWRWPPRRLYVPPTVAGPVLVLGLAVLALAVVSGIDQSFDLFVAGVGAFMALGAAVTIVSERRVRAVRARERARTDAP